MTTNCNQCGKAVPETKVREAIRKRGRDKSRGHHNISAIERTMMHIIIPKQNVFSVEKSLEYVEVFGRQEMQRL